MRMKLLRLSLAAALFAPVLARAAKVCDQDYHLQEATQYILTGPTLSELSSGAPTKLDKAFTLATFLHDSTSYKIVTDWNAKGSCDGWVKREVTYAIREVAAPKFVSSASGDEYIRFFDGEYVYKKPGWDEYWFGIADEMHGDTAIISGEVGKFKSESQLTLWYGAVTMKVTTRTKNGALVGTQNGFLRSAASHPDSAKLAADLLDSWKDIKLGDTQTVDFTLQLIRIRYDSLASPQSGIVPRNKGKTGFLARQTGNLVLIRTGEKSSGSEPLSLFNMLGTRVATIHPTGFVYQWNGKTSSGAEAPAGVYFVQSGNRVLGKFFFSSR